MSRVYADLSSRERRCHEKVIRRFQARFRVEGDCWMWQGFIQPKTGYGDFSVKRKTWSAHRFSYTIYRGEIPEGLHVCHTCDVRACVNPAHLFVGTAFDNMRDAKVKGRIPRGSTVGTSRLTESQVPKIRRLLASKKMTQWAIARKFGVSQSTISFIKRRIRWNHVEAQ